MEKKSRTKDMYIDRLVTTFHNEIEFWNKKLYPKKPISFYDVIQEYHKKYSKPSDGFYVPNKNYNPLEGCVVVPYVHDVGDIEKSKEVKSTLTTTNKDGNS